MSTANTFDLVHEILAERAAESGEQFALVRDYASTKPRLMPWSDISLPSHVHRCLAMEFPSGLFQHQAAAMRELGGSNHVVVATRTSSGKSLIYTIPVARALVESDEATALLFFPTRALANDQLNTLRQRLAQIVTATGKNCPPHMIARYDGSTPPDDRPAIRQAVRVLLTNPDMAHQSLLAWHEAHWARFLSNLRYVILDEAHEYRGTFGTNVALMLRRLGLLCKRYGSAPQYIATSATIQDPAEHLRLLTGMEFQTVPPEEDGSLQGPKRFWIVRPSGHAYTTARHILDQLVSKGKMVIAFCTSRKSAEENAEHFSDNPESRIRVYRAGLLAQDRHAIEEGLRTGTVRGVFATSALELGIDIGLLDVCICIGLPNTMMSLWQRAGRVGRGGKPGAVILIPEARPLDAYYAAHPEHLFARPNEPLAINMNSRTLAKWHLACCIKETGGHLDKTQPSELGMPMERIAVEYLAGKFDDNIFHTEQPHREYDIRAGADTSFELTLSEDGRDTVIGDINRSQLLMEAAPNAIYRHNLQRYRVTRVIDRDKTVRLRREPRYNRTSAYVNKRVRVLSCTGSRKNGILQIDECDRLRVTESLVSVIEKSRDGKTVRNWQGSQGLSPNYLPTSGVVAIVHDPVILMQGFGTPAAAGTAAQLAWNGLAPLLTGMLPTVLGPCDLGDFAIHSQWEQIDAKLYLYDRAYDGIDLTLGAFERIELLLSASYQRLTECECEDAVGCFRCVRHPFEDFPTDRLATRHMLAALMTSLDSQPLQMSFRKESRVLMEEEGPQTCPLCHCKIGIDAKFCSNCGHKLVEA